MTTATILLLFAVVISLARVYRDSMDLYWRSAGVVAVLVSALLVLIAGLALVGMVPS